MGLTDAERITLEHLKQVQKNLEVEIERVTQELEEASLYRQRLQSYLNDNLLERKKEIEKEEGGYFSGNRDGFQGKKQKQEDLESLEKELVDAVRDESDVEEKLDQAKSQEKDIKSDLLSSKNELEQLKTQDAKNRELLESGTENGDRLLNKRSMNIAKREMYMRKIQELGSLPSSAELSSHSSFSIPALMRRLDGINKDIKKYSHVNKKAYDQYVHFSEQRELLLTRKKELDQGAEKVQELVESLDRKKDEAINRTFRGVSAHFKDVFKALVPNGCGELIMKTALLEDEEEDLEEDEYVEDVSSKKKKK